MITPAVGEPTVATWQPMTLDRLAGDLRERMGRGRRVLAVDGRSASGKTTLARRLAEALPAALVVSTDNVAWHESMFDWTRLLVDGVLRPFQAGAVVTYRPPAWDRHERAGAIEIPDWVQVLILEGVGASRADLTAWLDQTLWIQSDQAEAERRGIARDVASGVNGTEAATIAFWHAWQAEELSFLAHDRPWERADLIVAGTSPITTGDTGVHVVMMAYVAARHEEWLGLYRARAQQTADPQGGVLAVFDAYIDHAELGYEHGFRGCGLLNAAAELPVDSPGRDAVRRHKEQVESILTEHLQAITAPEEAAQLAEHCAFLLEGAMARAGLEGQSTRLEHAKQIATALVDAL